MKSSLRKKSAILLKCLLLVLCLFTLVSCSSEGEETPSEPSETETEIEQLTAENEKLRTELNEASNELKTAEAKVKELEDELEAMREVQAEPSPSVSVIVEATPPERTPAELLLGQWYFQEFHEEGVWSWMQTFIFNADGTGTVSRTYYIPKDEVEDVVVEIDDTGTYIYFLADVDMSDGLSWSLDGDTLHIDINNGESADLTYSSAQQTLTTKDGGLFVREMPTGMENYVERALYSENLEAKEAARRRRFLGMWYYDVLTWTFNEDGTGVWDIPKLGNQPAEKRAFTYEINDNGGIDDYLCLTLNWEDSDYWILYPSFNANGSMSIRGIGQSEPAMTWTRTFDPNNCPVTAQIISNQMGVFTGSMFSDMLNNALGGD